MTFTLPFLRSETEVPPIERLVVDFESLGDNCEFGLVQRFAGAEPLGLFRFSASTIPNLIHALDTDLAEYGTEGDLAIEQGPLGYLFCHSRRYGFAYNTGEFVAKADPAALLVREYKKTAYLKDRFLADLADGEKIVVRKGRPGETFEDVMQLVTALRRHGPARLLRVLQAGEGHGPGEVAWRADGVMQGYVERFAPYEKVTEIALEGWLALCRNAWGLARGMTVADAAMPPNLLAGAAGATQPHVAEAHDAVVAQRAVGKLHACAMHAFSAWIWLPQAFRGERVAAEFGRLQLGHREADLSRRECWQRVWAAARLDKRVHEAEPRLRYRGPPGERFWSTAWRLEEGPVPAAGVKAPTIAICEPSSKGEPCGGGSPR